MSMDVVALYRDHIRARSEWAEKALESAGFDAVVLGAGSPIFYFQDDMEPPFRPNPHFASWCPVGGPHHALVIRRGRRPRLVRWSPQDYWYERAPLTGASAFWANEFDVEEAPEPETVMAQAIAAAGSGAKTSAFVGEDAALASANGLAVNPPSLVSWLDWDRARKTAYEVHCLEEATAASARGHAAAREAFLAGASELSIHHAYVRATGCADDALPYPTIVCLDEKAAVLHYHAKRPSGSGRNLLIDAGATTRGYGCDITRTTTRDDADPLFRALVSGVNALQQRLCAMVKPGASYIDIHLTAHREVAVLLKETALLKASVDEAVERRYTTPFFPHGVGHHLGIQVHDIGGHQTGPAGGTTPPPAGHPFLRNTRPIEADHVFTIEPGLYFIHMLLKPLRAEAGAAFDWTAIDALAPYGGVRVEDNLVVTASGHRNLTREQLPN